jgi:hypothetical protein
LPSDELADDDLDDSNGSRVSGKMAAEFPEPTSVGRMVLLVGRMELPRRDHPMTTPKKPTLVAAKLEKPPKNDGDSLVATTNQQLSTITGNTDYPNQLALQAIVKTTQTDSTTLGGTLAALAKAHAVIPVLETQRDTQIASLLRDRHNLQGTLTAICGGNLALIKGWGAVPGVVTKTPETTDAPTGAKATTSKTTPGTVLAKCPALPGVTTYFWVLGADPGPPAATVKPAVTTGSRTRFTGLTAGQVMYLRVAVVRRHGGVSAWSEAVQVTVR